MSNEGAFSPSCPSCGKQMTLARTAPPVGAPTGLRTYRCVACGVSETRTERQERPPDEDAAKRRRAPLSGAVSLKRQRAVATWNIMAPKSLAHC